MIPLEQLGKPFVQWFKKHGVRPEIYHLSNSSSSSSSSSTTSEQEAAVAPEGFESIAKALSIGEEEEEEVCLDPAAIL